MRRFLFGVVIASVTAAVPTMALGGDREIAKTVMSELQQHKNAGHLKGFDINLKVEDGVVYLSGEVASREQRNLIAQAAASAAGSKNVVDEIQVRTVKTEAVQPASSIELPVTPSSEDEAITDRIVEELAIAKASGTLRGFDLDVSTVNGDVWIRGSVSNERQKAVVLEAARKTTGVLRVIDDIAIIDKSRPNKGPEISAGNVLPASTETPLPIPTPQAVAPAPQASAPVSRPSAPVPGPEMMPVAAHQTANMVAHPASMPTMGYPVQAMPMQPVPMNAGPQPMGAGHMVGYPMQGAGGMPVPMHHASAQMGMGAPRYDQPNLPNYAWPTYAAYPNYAAVTYPKQYSPSAWPYIGPFYPYPQVPLGWRKVSLQWDDGLWYLDFTSK
jgi:osmotically-inducible protein OsmY